MPHRIRSADWQPVARHSPGLLRDLTHPLSRGLIALWRSDFSDRRLVEVIGGNHAVVTAFLVTSTIKDAGPHGPAVCLIGTGTTGSYFSAPADPRYDNLTLAPMTIAVWARLDPGGSTTFQNFLVKAANSNPTSGWSLDLDVANTRLEFGIACATSALDAAAATGSLTKDGVWHHLVVTYAASLTTAPLASDVTFYIDGKVSPQALSTNGVGAVSTDVGQTLKIGDDGSSNTVYINGAFESVTLWNRLLTASEVQLLYRAPYNMFAKPGVERGWWDGDTTTIPPVTVTYSQLERHTRGLERGIVTGGWGL